MDALVKACARGIVTMVVGGIALLISGPHAWRVWRLADEGREVMAKVTAYTPQECGKQRICEYHALSADGREFRLDLKAKRPIGEETRLTYSPEDPSVAFPGPKPASRVESVKLALGQGDLYVVFALFGILALIVGLMQRYLYGLFVSGKLDGGSR